MKAVRPVYPFSEIDSSTAQSPSDFIEPCRRLVNSLGFGNFSYFTISTGNLVDDAQDIPWFITSYPSAWTKRYLSKRYYQFDPVIEDSRSTQLPVIWGGSRYLKSLENVSRLVMTEARDFGITSAMSVPIHGFDGRFGLFTVSCDWTRSRFNGHVQDQIPEVIAIGLRIHDIVSQYLSPTYDQNRPHLTLRQKQCLRLVLEGKTSGEIAHTISRSEATVRYHLQNAARKLSASNTVHAAFLAHKASLL